MIFNKDKTIRVLRFLGYVLAILLIGFYLFFWFFYKGSFHVESTIDIRNMVKGFLTKDMISTIFDLDMIEGGCYRPRLMGFLIQYFDIKSWAFLNTIMPWGGHFPFVVVGIPLLVWGGWYILKHINKYGYWNVALSACMLYVPTYLCTTFLFLRTAKLLTPGLSVCIFGLILSCKKDVNIKELKNIIFELIVGFVISLFMTTDEQLVALVLLFTVVFSTLSFFEKNGWRRVRICAASVGFYCIFYLWWGRFLFEKYTGHELYKHPHTFLGAIVEFPRHIVRGIVLYKRALKYVLLDSNIVLILAFILFLVLLLKCSWKYRLLAFELVAGAIALCIGMDSAHPSIFNNYELARSMYLLNPVYLTIFAVLLLLFKAEWVDGSESKKQNIYVKYLLVAVLIILVGHSFINMKKISVDVELLSGEFIIPQHGSAYDVNEVLLKDEYVKQYGITRDYFSGLIIYPEDYYKYLGTR